MDYLLLSLSSLALGVIHGFDTDHVIDVTDFVSQDPRPLQAAFFGARFGIGHTITVMTLALVVYTLKSVVPAYVEGTFQLLSGIVLIVLGIWGIRRRLGSPWDASRRHKFSHGHEVNCTTGRTPVDDAVFRHGPIVTGVMTGMVGTAGVMLFGPVAAAPSVWWVTFFILLYGLGVIGAMCGYGFVAGKLFRSGFMGRLGRVSKVANLVPGMASIALGSVWFYRVVVGLKEVTGTINYYLNP